MSCQILLPLGVLDNSNLQRSHIKHSSKQTQYTETYHKQKTYIGNLKPSGGGWHLQFGHVTPIDNGRFKNAPHNRFMRTLVHLTLNALSEEATDGVRAWAVRMPKLWLYMVVQTRQNPSQIACIWLTHRNNTAGLGRAGRQLEGQINRSIYEESPNPLHL
jgi:hypothetical protein